MLLSFLPFPGRVENEKCYGSLRLLNSFKNVLQIMIGVLGLYKNVRGDRALPHNLVFLFQVKNEMHGRSENMEYLWHYATNFLSS